MKIKVYANVWCPIFTVIEAACQNSIYRTRDRKPAHVYFTVLCSSVLS